MLIGTETMGVTETARKLGVGRNTIYKQIQEGRVPHLHMGKRLLIPRAQFNQLLRGEWKQQPCEECTPGDSAVRYLRKVS